MTTMTQPTRLRRLMRFLMSAMVTAICVAGAVFAVVFGSDLLAERAEAGRVVASADRMPVQVDEVIFADGYGVTRRFVGQVEAAASVALSFELSGRLSEIVVEEGANVKAGQLMARLDTALLRSEKERLDASRAATAAQSKFAESRLNRAVSLRRQGYASEEAVDEARATRDELLNRVREIDAALNAVAINLEKSELFAPFDGQIGMRNVDGGETLSAGAPVLTLIKSASPMVRVGLPLSIETSDLDTAEIMIDDATFPARLAHVRPDIDPVTRTRTAIFSIEADHAPAFGRTASLILETAIEAHGAWVPLDALQEGLGGVWTVLIVDDGVVRNAAVEILHTEAARVYVRGTFEPGALLIDTGAHRVVPGQQVRVLAEAE